MSGYRWAVSVESPRGVESRSGLSYDLAAVHNNIVAAVSAFSHEVFQAELGDALQRLHELCQSGSTGGGVAARGRYEITIELSRRGAE